VELNTGEEDVYCIPAPDVYGEHKEEVGGDLDDRDENIAEGNRIWSLPTFNNSLILILCILVSKGLIPKSHSCINE